MCFAEILKYRNGHANHIDIKVRNALVRGETS